MVEVRGDKCELTWLITGCSSGLGKALAEAALEAGHRVVATARDASRVAELGAGHPDRFLGLALDVDDVGSIDWAIEQTNSRFGPVDVLINNAGYSYRGALEEGDPDEIHALFSTNVFGPINLIKAILPQMRAQRHGTIVNVSSIAGLLSIAGSGYYSATKFALEGLSEALRKEVAHLGIRVLVVEPGALRTDFSGRSLRGTVRTIPDYDETVGPRRKENDRSDGTQQGDPARAARAVLEALASPEPPARLLLGTDALAIVRADLVRRSAEVEHWKDLTASIDFTDN